MKQYKNQRSNCKKIDLWLYTGEYALHSVKQHLLVYAFSNNEHLVHIIVYTFPVFSCIDFGGF